MPTQLELDLMNAHCRDKGLAVVPPVGDGLPLITYWGPVNDASIRVKATTGQHIRAACLALRHGIGPAAWSARLFNLNRQGPDRAAFEAGDWAGAENGGWNGVWIHQGHGGPGSVVADSILGGKSFYDFAGCHVLHRPGFRHGLMKTCHAAARPYHDLSLIEVLAKAAKKSGNPVRGRLYGARCVTWVPVSGRCFGLPLTSFAIAVEAYVRRDLPPFDPVTMSASDYHDERLRLQTEAEALYFQGRGAVLEVFRQNPIDGLDLLAEGIAPAFEALAAFRPDAARAFTDPDGEEETAMDEDPAWYGLDLGSGLINSHTILF